MVVQLFFNKYVPLEPQNPEKEEPLGKQEHDKKQEEAHRLKIIQVQAQADPATGEINPADGGVNWMTENFVPFKGDIKAPISYISSATLILRKNNASGLSQHDASISFPIMVEY